MYSRVEILGGTGMLSTATIKIANDSKKSIVYGRDSKKLEYVRKQVSSSQIDLRILDYSNIELIEKNFSRNTLLYGEVDLVLCWIHSTHFQSLKAIINFIDKSQSKIWNLIIVENHLESISKKLNKLEAPTNCKIQFVKLGYISEGINKRWLTHQEISNGVIEAYKTGKDIVQVGLI